MPLTQALECSTFSANLPQFLVFKAPHGGLSEDWNGRWEEKEGEWAFDHAVP